METMCVIELIVTEVKRFNAGSKRPIRLRKLLLRRLFDIGFSTHGFVVVDEGLLVAVVIFAR